jgi:hypothetical protein
MLMRYTASTLIVLLLMVSMSMEVVWAQPLSPFQTFTLLNSDIHTYTYESSHSNIIPRRNVKHGSVHVTPHPGSHNRFDLNYTPHANYIGRDTFIFEYWIVSPYGTSLKQANIIYDVRQFILMDDYFVVDQIGEWYDLDVLLNDNFFGSLSVELIPLQSNCELQINDDNIVQFRANSVGSHHFKYVACNENMICAPASVVVNVQPTTQGNQSMHFQRSTLKNLAVPIFLPFHGFDLIQSPLHGSLSFVSDIIVRYQPNTNFTGSDVFVLEFNDGQHTTTLTVSIQVIDFGSPNIFVIDDQFFTALNTPITINVRANDLERNTPIQSFTQPANGSIINLGSGNFSYTPANNFAGVDAFTYRVCPTQGTGCETGVVTIHVNNQKPTGNLYTFTTAKNVPYIVRYQVPIQSFNFEIIDNPLLGNLTFYPGNQSINIAGQDISGFNLMVYEPGFNEVGKDEMRVKYCVGNDCREIKLDIEIIDYFPDIICLTDCVWPGDVNYDGKVDMVDLLPLAHYIGHFGQPRDTEDTNMWLAQSSTNWNELQVFTAVDLKHADTDGNGVVTAADTSAIKNNYLKYHRFTRPVSNPLASIPFILAPLNSGPLSEGDTARFNIQIGNAQFPAISMSGLCFELDFIGADYLNTESIKVNLHHENWLTSDAPSLRLTLEASDTRVDAGLARADGRFSSGFGIIGQLEFIVVKDLDGFHTGGNLVQIPVKITNGHVMTGDGQLFSVPESQSSVTLRIDRTNENSDQNSQLNVFPNPATNELTVGIKNSQILLQEVELISLTGSTLLKMDGLSQANVLLNTSSLNSGFYLVRAMTSSGVMVSKVQIIK